MTKKKYTLNDAIRIVKDAIKKDGGKLSNYDAKDIRRAARELLKAND